MKCGSVLTEENSASCNVKFKHELPHKPSTPFLLTLEHSHPHLHLQDVCLSSTCPYSCNLRSSYSRREREDLWRAVEQAVIIFTVTRSKRMAVRIGYWGHHPWSSLWAACQNLKQKKSVCHCAPKIESKSKQSCLTQEQSHNGRQVTKNPFNSSSHHHHHKFIQFSGTLKFGKATSTMNFWIQRHNKQLLISNPFLFYYMSIRNHRV